MQLRQYLQDHALTHAAFGQQLNPPVSAGKVNHWIQGTRRVSLAEALQIQVLTGGEVSLPELAAMAAKPQTAVEGAAAHA